MSTIKRWWINRKLAQAREQYAYYKGKREALTATAWQCVGYVDQNAELAGKQALYEERVERLMREVGK